MRTQRPTYELEFSQDQRKRQKIANFALGECGGFANGQNL